MLCELKDNILYTKALDYRDEKRVALCLNQFKRFIDKRFRTLLTENEQLCPFYPIVVRLLVAYPHYLPLSNCVDTVRSFYHKASKDAVAADLLKAVEELAQSKELFRCYHKISSQVYHNQQN